MDKEDLKQAMLQAQEMQFGLLKAQDDLQHTEVTGECPGALVSVKMLAHGEPVAVEIKPELLSKDKESVEKAILEAMQDATKNCSELARKKLEDVSKQLGIQS